MRSISRLAAAAVTAAIALAAVAADDVALQGFTDAETDLFFAQQEAWFTAGASGVGNLDYVAGDIPSWNSAPPSGSTAYTVMNNYSTFAGDRYQNTFTAQGTFTGHLENIAIEFIAKTFAEAACQVDALAWDLRVDGEQILFTNQIEPSAGLQTSPLGENYQVRFVFTGIHDVMADRDIVGDETTEHTVFMNFANFYACQESYALYGSAETPARLLANTQPQGRRGNWVQYTEIPVRNPPPPLPS
jgi:hypothetical protein